MAVVALRHTVAVLGGLAACRRAKPFVTSLADGRRFVRKTVNCALCYVGLGATGSWREAWQAGRASFLSTAFDAATDWRQFDPRAVAAFDRVLTAMVADPELARLTRDLLARKRTREFSDDGLERGILALRLILGLMGSTAARERQWNGLSDVGQTLQLIDDVLDYEDDVRRGDLTSLTSARARAYLTTLVERETRGELDRWFGPGESVLLHVARRAAAEARRLLAAQH